jgi:actin-related protein
VAKFRLRDGSKVFKFGNDMYRQHFNTQSAETIVSAFPDGLFSEPYTWEYNTTERIIQNAQDEFYKYKGQCCSALFSENIVLTTERTKSSKTAREKMTQIMFETFGVVGYFTASQAALSLLASGKSTGLVVHLGHQVSEIVPVYFGCPLVSHISTFDVTGKDLEEYFENKLEETGAFEKLRSTFAGVGWKYDRKVFSRGAMKECYVEAYPGCNEPPRSTHYLELGQYLSDSKEIHKIPLNVDGKARVNTPECLFHPEILDKQTLGIHEQIIATIEQFDDDIQPLLLKNIVLSGGASNFPGIENRLHSELCNLKNGELNVSLAPEGRWSAWCGGSKLTEEARFESMVIEKEAFDEHGPSVVHRMCLGV